MAEVIEDGVPQNPTPVVEPKTLEGVVVSQKELDELKYRASTSSQNYERLKEETSRREQLEAELENIRNLNVPSGFDDEKVAMLASDVAEMKNRQQKSDVIEAYPQLKDLWSDFEAFRQDSDNKGMNLRTAAKAFLTEKDILSPQRKGLEQPTGGDRVPATSGKLTPDEAKRLRESDYRKYTDLLKKGLIEVS